MEPNAAAEELPALYRAVLDRIAELSAGGDRRTANQVRAEAIRIYARAWDARAYRELQALLRRNLDDAVPMHAPGRSLRRRFIRAT
jgi:hypothetical protein